MQKSVITILILSVSFFASALLITYPIAGTTVSNKMDFHIKWTASFSEPARIDIVLTNDNDEQTNLGTNISSLDRAYTVDSLTIVSQAWTGNDFKIIINSAGDLGNDLLATSGEFTITNSTNTSPTPTDTSYVTSTSIAATAANTSSGVATSKSGGQSVLGALAAGVLALAV